MSLHKLFFAIILGTLACTACNSGLSVENVSADKCPDSSNEDCPGTPAASDESTPANSNSFSDPSDAEPVCGNGEVETGERCDDGNTLDDDYCSSDCQTRTGSCGDQTLQGNETCDDGNTLDSDYCSSDCQSITGECGDETVQVNEACDDGNTLGDDYCSPDCLVEMGVCGDGEIGPGEICETDIPCNELHPTLTSGTALCNDDCLGLDYSGCADFPEDMVPVPAGYFWMGCNEVVDDQCNPDESPYHQVYLDAYLIDRYEVTAGDYKACVEANRCGYLMTPPDSYYTYDNGRDNHPMIHVEYEDVRRYCRWRGKRIPTEAQWEKAARGTDGRKYPWGNSPDVTCTHAVVGEDYSQGACGMNLTWEVGSKPLGVSPYGAHDMIGNVFELTSDKYSSSYYEDTPPGGWVNPTGPVAGHYHVHRGSAWGHFEGMPAHRVSFRKYHGPYHRHYKYGFRCVR